MKILVVDDSAVMRNMVKRSLKKGGVEAEVLEAADGLQGLEQLASEPDVVLCDWNMPNMDGLAFVRRIRADGNDTPVIMVTTETHFAKKREATDAGVNSFIAKPFTPDELAEQVRSLVPA